MTSNWNAYWRLMRFDRPIGALLLLWPTWWALVMAGNGRPAIRNVLIFTAGVLVMRAAGCVMNDIADRNFDPRVERTRNRPVATGEVAVRQALWLFAVLMAAAFALVLLTNRLTVLLALAGALLAASYPFFKRFTHLPQAVLGIAFGWGIPMVYAAESEAVPGEAWLLFAVNFFWVLVYDTLYAMVDREDDLAIGVKSAAILLGRLDLAGIGCFMLFMIALLAVFGWFYGLNWPFHAGVAAAALMFALQLYRVRTRDRDACFQAFVGNNRVGLAVFLGLAGHYMLAGGST